jgi:tRNA/tmRNA/rRNA uracil-C5-methylase (TrmA/RlmC/RlmD family)
VHFQEVNSDGSGLTFAVKAGDFWQNNKYCLPVMIDYVIGMAMANQPIHAASASASTLVSASSPAAVTTRHAQFRYLVDTYCGSGLFCLYGARHFEKCVGIGRNRYM